MAVFTFSRLSVFLVLSFLFFSSCPAFGIDRQEVNSGSLPMETGKSVNFEEYGNGVSSMKQSVLEPESSSPSAHPVIVTKPDEHRPSVQVTDVSHAQLLKGDRSVKTFGSSDASSSQVRDTESDAPIIHQAISERKDSEASSKEIPGRGKSPKEDAELLDKLQRDAFRYMWEHTFAESGLAYEDSRNAESGQATIGGTGFGIAAIIVAAERGWISREDAARRLLKISLFLRDRTERKSLHGAFPHWLDGRTGKTIAFGKDDSGADIVETAFLMQGLLLARAYFNADSSLENELRVCVTDMWREVDWHWFANGANNGLFWHWTPDGGFGKGMKISGFNEAMVTYVLALGAPIHPISRETAKFWYSTDEYQPKTGNGYTIQAANKYAGCMFLSHYSFIGLNPSLMADGLVSKGYMVRNTTHALMNRAYCLESAPSENKYGEGVWGLTSCNIKEGYRYQSAYNEVGTIAPTAALASMPYVPEYAMRVLWNLYENYRGFWGAYGPCDAFSLKDGWFDTSYLAIDQLTIVSMVENYRSGLLWRLFMSIPEVRQGLARLGVREPEYVDGFPHVVLPLRQTNTGYAEDSLDIRRNPDSLQYQIPFSVASEKAVEFTLLAEQRELASFIVQAKKGQNVFHFEAPESFVGSELVLRMSTGEEKFDLPIRLN